MVGSVLFQWRIALPLKFFIVHHYANFIIIMIIIIIIIIIYLFFTWKAVVGSQYEHSDLWRFWFTSKENKKEKKD